MSEMVGYIVFDASNDRPKEAEERVLEQLNEFTWAGISQATLLVNFSAYTTMYFLVCQDPDGAWYWLQTSAGDWYDVKQLPVREILVPSAESYTLIGA